MSHPSDFTLSQSLATQMLRMVFSFYLIVTCAVTLTHMSAEFFKTKEGISYELMVIGNNFTPGLTKALWDMNLEQITPTLQGIMQFPSVVGVKFTDQRGEDIGALGMITRGEQVVQVNADGSKTEVGGYTGLFDYRFPISYEHRGKVMGLGNVTLYSSTDVIIDKVKLGFTFIVANSVIKTVALWWLFIWIFRSMLSRPLRALTKATQSISLDKLEQVTIEVKTKGQNELKMLEVAFNAMIDKLLAARKQIQSFAQAYSRFFPHEFLDHLQKKSIVELKLGNSTQRKMNILFSDLRSFTRISETMTPEENFQFLNDYLSHMGPVIRQNDGFIDKYIGDAIMALFDEKPDHAVEAGIAMLKQLNHFNQLRQQEGLFPVQMGIGIHLGSVMLGTIGEEARMDTTVISDTVNQAARLEGMTKMYGVSLLISEEVWQHLIHPDDFAVRVIDKVQAKGKTEPVVIYEVFNGDLPDVYAKKSRTRQDFQEGICLYYEKQFAEAKVRFERCQAEFPEDKATKIYIKRCVHYLKVGWDDEWDGITVLDVK